MANIVSLAVAVRETLIQIPGRFPTAASTVREVLIGDRVGVDIKFNLTSAVREVVQGDRIGLDVTYALTVAVRELVVEVPGRWPAATSAVREIMTGNGVGFNTVFQLGSVVREVVVKEPPFKVESVVRESLVAIPNDPLRLAHVAAGLVQQVAMRVLRPPPSTVKGANIAYTLRQVVAQRNRRPAPHSPQDVAKLANLVAMHRVTPGIAHSVTSTSTLRMVVALSKSQAYIPTSGVYLASLRQISTHHRVTIPAGDIRTPIQAKTMRQVVAMSKRAAAVVTDVFASSFVAQVAMGRAITPPQSMSRVGKLAQIVTKTRDVTPPGIDDRVAALQEIVALERAPIEYIGMMRGAALRQVVAQQRAAQWPESQAIVAQYGQVVAQHRYTIPPAYLLGWRVPGLRQVIAIHRAAGPQRSEIVVGTLARIMTLRLVTPLPPDVIDPSVGRHVGRLAQVTAQHRDTLPPEQNGRRLFVFGAHTAVALGDKFEPVPPPVDGDSTLTAFALQMDVVMGDRKWDAVSRLTVQGVASALVLGDNHGWIDPVVPFSEIQVQQAGQAVALGDTFLDPMLPLSTADVSMLGQAVAIADEFVPANVPQSQAQALTVAEAVVLGDEFVPANVPQSAAQVLQVAQALLLGAEYPSPSTPQSDVRVSEVAMQVVLPDKLSVGLPIRTGARPVVSITIS